MRTRRRISTSAARSTSRATCLGRRRTTPTWWSSTGSSSRRGAANGGAALQACQIGSSMTTREVLSALEKAGKPQTAAIYKRHGAGDNVFGTLTSEIGRLQKKIKVDHALALELWKTGNAEARILAVQVADPQKVTGALAGKFLADGPVRFLGLYVAALIARSPVADKTMREWMNSPDEATRETGYNILSARLRDDADSISDADAGKAIATIEKQ